MANQAQRGGNRPWTLEIDVAGSDLREAAVAVAEILRSRAVPILLDLRRRALRVVVVNAARLSAALPPEVVAMMGSERMVREMKAVQELSIHELAIRPRSALYEGVQAALSVRPEAADRLLAGLEVFAGEVETHPDRRLVLRQPMSPLHGIAVRGLAAGSRGLVYEKLIERLLRTDTGGMVPVSEFVDDDSGELTLAPEDRSAFFHVSFSEAGIALGWSTPVPLDSCFRSLADRAAVSGHLLDDLLSGESATEVVQRNEGLEESSFEVGDFSQLSRHLSKLHPDGVLAYRLDVGQWSWEWDDLTGSEGIPRYSFGGLTDSEDKLERLQPLIEELGDEWVQANQVQLWEQVQDFLAQRHR